MGLPKAFKNSFGKPACFNDAVCSVAREDFVVDWEIAVRDGTVPNLAVAFPLAMKNSRSPGESASRWRS